MKKTLLALFTVGTIATMVCSCESFRPNDNLQKVVSGDIFNPKPFNPKEENALDEAAWREHQLYPAGYTVDPETANETRDGAIAFQMPVH